jgi:hypothetical protein
MHFPRTIRELRSLLGFANFARRFHANLAETLAPLTSCLRKGAKLEQNEQTLKAFEELKRVMTTPPVLTLFRTDSELFLECDASDYSVGVVLKSKSPDGEVGIIAYASKLLNDAQRRYCVTMKELYAIAYALSHFRHYLLGRKFDVFTDHCALKFLTRGKCLTSQIARYLDLIAEHQINILFKSGIDNVQADFLSRMRPCERNDGRVCLVVP